MLVASSVAVAKPLPSKLVVTEPIIEVLDRTGSVTVASVQEGLGKIDRDIAKCGDDSKWVGDALVWLVTDWHGKAMRVEVAVEKSSVERCLETVLKRVVVPKAQSRATTMMRLRIAPPAPNPDDQLK